MNLAKAMASYAHTDKEYFPSQNGADDTTRPNSLFFADFLVAEYYGKDAIKDTFNRAMEWRNDAKMWTELTIVLNRRLWKHHEDGNMEYSVIYDSLWRKADEIASTFSGDDAKHYYTITD